MAQLDIQKCPETGICSITNSKGAKIDIIAMEADQLRQAGDDPAKIKEVLAQIDSSFPETLTEADLNEIARHFK